MTTTRKQHSPKFKAQVALEAIRGEKTLSPLGSQFKVHPIQMAKWRKSALAHLPELFVDGRTRPAHTGEAEADALYEQIGRWKVELDWLQKSRLARLRSGALSSSGTMPRSAFGGNVNYWDSAGLVFITSRWARGKRTFT